MVQRTALICILPLWVCYNDFPLQTAWNNSAAFSCTESPYRLFIFSWTVPAANSDVLGSGYTMALRYFLHKDCFLSNCEKLRLVKKRETLSIPPAESKEERSDWPSLCECRAAEVLKKCQVSYEFKWWMFFFMGSARMGTKSLQSRKERLVSVPRDCRFFVWLLWFLPVR